MAVDGVWKIVADTPMGRQESSLELQTSGSVLTGRAASLFGAVELTDGVIEGDEARWVLTLTIPFALTLKHTARFEGDAVSGSIDTGMFGVMPFTGVRG